MKSWHEIQIFNATNVCHILQLLGLDFEKMYFCFEEKNLGDHGFVKS